jgi:hypothetical protein
MVPHYFFRLAFNDVTKETAGLNEVRFSPRVYWKNKQGPIWDPKDDLINSKLPGFYANLFEPAGTGGGPWRTLVIRVTRDQISAWWAGKTLVGQLSLAELTQRAAVGIPTSPGLQRGVLLEEGLDPRFDVRGAIGLYLDHSAASFQTMVVTPLGKDD